MSPIGKVFVVLNLIFSLVILGVVGAILSKSEEFKTLYETSQQALADAEADWDQVRGTLQSEIDGHKREDARKTEEINNQTATINSLENDNNSLRVDNEQLRGDISKIQADYQKFTTSLQEQISHAQGLTQANQDLINERNSAIDERRAALEDSARLESQVNSLTATVEQLQKQIDELTAARNDLSAQIEAAIQAGFDISQVRASPKIDSVVEHVNTALGIVVLSVGADDGVTQGMKFYVFDDQYKGAVIVDDVYPDNSAAHIVPNGSGLQIRVMDKATTRL